MLNKTINQLIKEYAPYHKFANIIPNDEFNDWYVVFDGAGGLSCVKFGNSKSLNDIEKTSGWATENNVGDILAMKFDDSYLEHNSNLKMNVM